MASFGLQRPSAAAAAVPEQLIEAGTPWIAAADGKLSLLQTSLQRLQLPVTAADETGYTLLQAAASYGQLPVLQWILSQIHADPNGINAVDHEGDSALHYAGTAEAARMLVEVGRINVGLVNRQGKTALQQKQEELQQLLDDEDEDSDSEDVESLKKQVEFLTQLQQ
ncbi:Ankyrin Repeat [Seminavis robusta]|uniref:Ankyrin Repeat n=1 Tax=Seminavis robusta TaxID=568900 RepID=A0A9N8DIP2_9STRA|nr:Ankyrin Repeat [Seminavis robusta]|eukprot:Sro179_g078360.1 Ankyrin Repeat (167) ;mRNA; f:11998-12498